MKLLLTSAGVPNDIIREALLDMLGKPIDESKAICIPTAIYALPGLQKNKVYMGISAGGGMVTHSLNIKHEHLKNTVSTMTMNTTKPPRRMRGVTRR